MRSLAGATSAPAAERAMSGSPRAAPQREPGFLYARSRSGGRARRAADLGLLSLLTVGCSYDTYI